MRFYFWQSNWKQGWGKIALKKKKRIKVKILLQSENYILFLSYFVVIKKEKKREKGDGMEQLKFARTLCAILRCSNELCNRCFILVQFRIIYNSNSALFNHWCIQPVPFMLSLSSFRYTINHLNEYYTISNNYTFNCISTPPLLPFIPFHHFNDYFNVVHPPK